MNSAHVKLHNSVCKQNCQELQSFILSGFNRQVKRQFLTTWKNVVGIQNSEMLIILINALL